jgi:hypothetical protein
MSRAVLDGDDNNIAKVIKKVAKEVVIEKPWHGMEWNDEVSFYDSCCYDVFF